jgi:ribosomal protein S18 acetylase RimI-like enzyme
MVAAMDFLIDTNIVIPAEPTSAREAEAATPIVAEFMRIVRTKGDRVLLHPDAFLEIRGDRDPVRRDLRLDLANKYPRLESPPDLSEDLAGIIGRPNRGSHNAVDARLLEAVRSGRADILVTDDAGLRRWARLADLGDRVLTSSDALLLARELHEAAPAVPPAARHVYAADLNVADAIFDELRGDYPGFDAWLAKAARLHRHAWIVERDDDRYAAVAIVNEETPLEHGLPGRLLKLCTFKVSEDHQGNRYGELLLKATLDYAHANGYGTVFVEARPGKQFLFEFLEQFGFRRLDVLKSGTDPVYAKPLTPPIGGAPHLSPLEYHVTFGPPALRWEGVPAFIVPIRPEYHYRLFPEAEPLDAEPQLSLLTGAEAHGNGIRKAYLCRANTRGIGEGNVLYFYRSVSSALTVVGVVEDVSLLSDPAGIVRAAGKRTLYTYHQIEEMAAGEREVLVIGFRQARVVRPPVGFTELVVGGVLRGPPQTVMSIGEEAARWLAQRVQL